MIAAFDTYYNNETGTAKTACVVFENWNDSVPTKVYTEVTKIEDEYIPGEFYRREMPCIISILKKIELPIHTIIIDGFVYLDDSGTAGLGARLYEHLGKTIPIVGVAKTDFARIETLKRKVLRGESSNPLLVTAIGLNLDVVAAKVTSMFGSYRIPDLLKIVDKHTREK